MADARLAVAVDFSSSALLYALPASIRSSYARNESRRSLANPDASGEGRTHRGVSSITTRPPTQRVREHAADGGMRSHLLLMITWGALVPTSDPVVVCEKDGEGGRLNAPPPVVEDVFDRRESRRGRDVLRSRSYPVAIAKAQTMTDERERNESLASE